MMMTLMTTATMINTVAGHDDADSDNVGGDNYCSLCKCFKKEDFAYVS